MSYQPLFIGRLKIFLFLGFFSTSLYSSIEDYYPVKIGPTSGNYGITGVFETPNARFIEAGSMRFSFSSSWPHEFTSVTATPFSWMEAGYRYTELKNKLYGPRIYSGNQTLKDKGFDAKFRILKENYYIPAIALGLRDVGGTGLFASEYIVASKRLGPLDLSLGLGWGALGRLNNIKNPFYSLDDSFRYRKGEFGQGGTFNYSDWFSGESALFSSFEYYLPRHRLKFKAEYDSTYPIQEDVFVDSRFNFGVDYFISDSLNLGLAFERGNQFRLSFSITGGFSNDEIPKFDPPKNIVQLNPRQAARIRSNKKIFYRSLSKSLIDESIYIQSATLQDDNLKFSIMQNRFRTFTQPAGRAARIASALLPPEVQFIEVSVMNGDFEVGAINFNRAEFLKTDELKVSTQELLSKSEITSNSGQLSYKDADFQPVVVLPDWIWSMQPALKHQLGGPEAFYLGQVWWRVDGALKIRRGLTLTASLGFDLFNNFNKFNNASYSEIPHVRSDIQEYLREGKSNIATLKLDYMWSPADDWFARLDIGYIEEMFAGVGGEVLYRPFYSNMAVGLLLHKVKQREYKQRFGFRDYQTTTGHISFYNDWPYGLTTQVSIGKYLAGDNGVTADLSRRFKSGFRLGVFATITDLSAEEFGEGSFDKGIYFAIPTELFFTSYQTGALAFGMHPLTKDGGAMLFNHHSLYSVLGDSTRNSFLRDWENIID